MAVRKKTTNRKTGAAKKRKARTGAAATLKIAGSGTFTKTSCHSTKTEAGKRAESIRKAGHKARVIKNDGGGHCVYKGAKMKANAPAMKALKAKRKRA